MSNGISITKSEKARRAFINTILYLICISIGVTMIAPFIWMVSTSLKEPGAVFTYPPEFIPKAQVRIDYNGEKYPVFKTKINGKEEYVIRLTIRENKSDIKVVKNIEKGEIDEERGILKASTDSLKPYKKIKIVWKNYVDAWNAVPFGRFFINSIIVSVCVTFGQVFTSSLAGYAFARLSFKGRDTLFLGYLATMMIPGTVTMIPVFIIIKKFGWLDTYQALILPGMFSAYGTFLLRQFFLSIPKDLEESAVIDGATKFRIYWQIILPLSKPALATLTTFTFMWVWNDFMWPLIVTSKMEMRTLPVGLASFQGLYTTNWTLLMAASVIVLMPVLILYIYNQRFFVRGITLSGLKI
jgi:multiple sugar transport system permease protein